MVIITLIIREGYLKQMKEKVKLRINDRCFFYLLQRR